jgi:hypothetical protein
VQRQRSHRNNPDANFVRLNLYNEFLLSWGKIVFNSKKRFAAKIDFGFFRRE